MAKALAKIRLTMWVVANGKIGILTEIRPDSFVVDFVNPSDGTTLLPGVVDPKNLRQARWAEIPECRRPPKEASRRLGYV